ncbi:DUF305 domain-containing protein, partial [Rhodococcus zopfii]|uniref:DUF305 domain-containing protein n=1 Tax=Rhodococcus zopfii TaxID=43772 RepID=UPI00365452CA
AVLGGARRSRPRGGGGAPSPPPPPDTGTAATTGALADSDIAFAQEMSMHHQQAITMTDMLGRDAAPDVRALAAQIRASQWQEIGILTGWLELAGAPAQPPGHDHLGMPGIATNEELTRLHDAVGTEREILFLQLMIRHHQGGIDMAADAAHTTTVPAVRARATAIVDEQRQEISLMAVSLDARGASVLPYP